MKTPWAKAEEIANKFEGKASKLLVFWGALTGIIALIPTVFAVIYYVCTIAVHIYHIDKYVTEINAAQKYNYFMIGQLSRMVEAEADHKVSFGIPIRMTNAPKGATQGDYWYVSYVKVNGTWRPIIYGAFPNMTRKEVGLLDINGNYIIAGKEPHPDKEELEKLSKQH